jgi:hypothetical protein
MSNETIVQNGAVEATSQNEKESTRALRGKIARLPKDIREELNRRLDNGQPAAEIATWLNEIPAVKEILTKYFGGKPINHRNVSNWRGGGYQRWLEKQESVDELNWLVEDAMDYSEVADGKLARGTASIATAKILKILQAMPAAPESLDGLAKISYSISALLNAEQGQARLEYEKTRVFQGNERLVLSWDEFLRDRVETAQRALNDAICKDIQAADIDNGEKIELLGYELFGKKWKGRAVGKKKETEKKEPEKETEGSKKDSSESEEVEKTEAREHIPVEARGDDAEGKPPHPDPLPQGGEGDGKRSADPSAADQQVRPTMTPDNGAEVKVSQTEMKETDAHVPIEAMDSKTTATPPEPKQEPPARELSPYEKAILEGQTPLAALYTQFTPDKNPKPKP